ncbi:MAG: hypothetical protein GWN39_09840, partial [Thermoplasmata archaeon]|nr:hypothetical protein [Thermoplasmata archaeon]NIS12349.1 hypothetical protein [Thermoplasmata archaeon]NIS20269.1 hypothetical protein [Thermoplasmata archaeon]NIV79033.1 hypothetical protein [Thermoplasmata archaeon]NIW89073.1 hypothetical protein [Thermoplasmata archaeon]
MDESVERFFIDSKMPDVFVDFNAPVNASDVDAVLSANPDVEAHDMRLKLGGTFTTEGDENIQAILIGTADPTRTDINMMEMVNGRFFSASGEANAVAGMEGKGVKKGAT